MERGVGITGSFPCLDSQGISSCLYPISSPLAPLPFSSAASDHVANNADSKSPQPVTAVAFSDAATPSLETRSFDIPAPITSDMPDVQGPGTATRPCRNTPSAPQRPPAPWRKLAAMRLCRNTPSAPQQPCPRFCRKPSSPVSIVVSVMPVWVSLDAFCPASSIGVLSGRPGYPPALVGGRPLDNALWRGNRPMGRQKGYDTMMNKMKD